ncbi:MAG TPA: NUDIX domain-containing protein [Candidatus Paceibacterota bacterium]|nr:NUDIX domain-containing protein [Candidatus Paceibacterota bacterium]
MAHIHEKIDFTASVYIVQDAKILLHKHKKLGIWLQPGGHVELDEGPTEAAIREAKEETGFDVELVGQHSPKTEPLGRSNSLLLPMFLNRHNYDATHEHIDFSYFARVVGGTLTPEDGVEMLWFSREQIEKGEVELLPDTRAYALAALDYFAQHS